MKGVGSLPMCHRGSSYTGLPLEGAPLVLSAGVRLIFCFKGAEQKMGQHHLRGGPIRPVSRASTISGRGRFPFPREKGSEKGSW